MIERFPRALMGLLLLFSSLALAAVAPRPGTAPSPPPPPTPGPAAIGQAPVILIYPFDVQTGADAKIGMAIAQILAQEMTAAGGISVPPVPQGVKRENFLQNALGAHADFYISGYVTPVGDSAAVVEQVVSVASGVILFSQTAQVSSVADVASQSLLARSQILALVGRGTEAMQTQTNNTPAPTSTNGAQMPLRGIASIVDSVFKHRGSSHPASPAPTTKPSRGVIVAPVAAAGSVAAADLANATHELYFEMNRHFATQLSTVAAGDVARSADQICGPNRDNTVASGTLEPAPGSHGKQNLVFNLTVYTCFGAPLEREVGKGLVGQERRGCSRNRVLQRAPRQQLTLEPGGGYSNSPIGGSIRILRDCSSIATTIDRTIGTICPLDDQHVAGGIMLDALDGAVGRAVLPANEAAYEVVVEILALVERDAPSRREEDAPGVSGRAIGIVYALNSNQ